jgi:prepilin-type N-terminal cleavage/methylation domain-containing protein
MKRNLKGFSLIEILVAMVILSAVILISNQAFSFFSNKWNGQLGRFDNIFGQARLNMVIDDVIRNTIPYIVTTTEGYGLYFEGNRNGFVAVSSSSLNDPDTPAVIRLSAIQQSDFSFILQYEEAPMSITVLRTNQDVVDFNEAITLQANIEDIQFEYYGLAAIENSQDNSARDLVWEHSFNGIEKREHPQKVRVFYRQNNTVSSQIFELIAPTVGMKTLLSEGVDGGRNAS